MVHKEAGANTSQVSAKVYEVLAELEEEYPDLGVAVAFDQAEFISDSISNVIWAIALGGVADILDGRVARVRGLASRYGAFIDSTLDRFVEVFAFLGFCVYLARFEAGPLLAMAAITSRSGRGAMLAASSSTTSSGGSRGFPFRAGRRTASSSTAPVSPTKTASRRPCPRTVRTISRCAFISPRSSR